MNIGSRCLFNEYAIVTRAQAALTGDDNDLSGEILPISHMKSMIFSLGEI